jgi:hypothetical protein
MLRVKTCHCGNHHVLVFVVDSAHQSSSGWKDLIDKDKDGLLRGKLDAFPDDINKLTDS